MNSKEIKKALIEKIKQDYGIETPFGKISIEQRNVIGEGGNGVVYKATLSGKEIAIKFLVTDSNEKYQRFLAEYFNINYVRESLKSIINMIAFGELEINNEEKCKIPYIIMNKYEKSLKKYRDTVSPSFNDVKRLLKTMLFSVESLHNKGILHRDIKPENILMDSEGNFLMADFGIASFDEERFPLDYKTKASSRMANASFSAPEQIDHSAKTTVASDIYSIGQIIYWFVFNRLKKGSDNACLIECF